MSGIAGLYLLDGRPVSGADLGAMVAPLERRGPDGTGVWRDGSVGLGHAALNTTPEACCEPQPVVARDGAPVITADARLDNRGELLMALGVPAAEGRELGDAGIILRAYREWGEPCVDRLLGDFAFAIWDARERRLFCARDHFGVRPLYYHHTPGRLFAWASEPRSLLTLGEVPHRINEGRIADFLISQLEGIDKTSTFFEEIYRLPPAHTLTVTAGDLQRRRYWRLEAGPELHLGSDEAYEEAFLGVFTEAVRCRLRGADTVGSMLSGGMDSGSVVAVARQLRAEAGEGPLPTFSAVGPDPGTCVETQAVHTAMTMGGIEPHMVSHGDLRKLLPELARWTWRLDEPFDGYTLIQAVYLEAHRRGVKAVLDGIDGDTVLSEGTHLARLLRRGRWGTAVREAVGLNRFYGDVYPAWRQLLRSTRTACVPNPLRRLRQVLVPPNYRARARRNIDASILSRDFARRVGLDRRLRRLDAHRAAAMAPELGQERARSLRHPYLTVGVERYNRVASAVAVEPRLPFLDRRVVDFCVRLPGDQKLRHGWPKAILRRAMAGRLPEAICRRRGKEHLGWAFQSALMDAMGQEAQRAISNDSGLLSRYVNIERLQTWSRLTFEHGDMTYAKDVFDAVYLAGWLRFHRGGSSSGINSRWIEGL